MSNTLGSILQSLLKIFCGSSQGQQHQQQYPQQQQQQQQQYQQGYNQQSAAYPPQQQPQAHSWANVAGGGGGGGGQAQQYYGGQQQQQQPHNNHNNHNHNNHNQNQHQNQHHQQPWQNGSSASTGSPHKPFHVPAGGVVGPHHPGYQNQDQINATNAQYTDLRNRARREGDEAHRCFAGSQQAYQSGDGARAHELSVEGKKHQARQDQLDDEASGWIFNQNNVSSPADTIDLHGLYVKEAIERTESAITTAQSQGQDTLRVIVGKGIHSQGHVAKIKPAVENLMVKYNLTAHVDPENTGVLIVDLTGRGGQGRSGSRDAGGLVDQLGGRDDQCTIM